MIRWQQTLRPLHLAGQLVSCELMLRRPFEVSTLPRWRGCKKRKSGRSLDTQNLQLRVLSTSKCRPISSTASMGLQITDLSRLG